MAIIQGNQKIRPYHNVNKELLKLKGDLDDRTARITLIKFLRYNIGLTVQLLLGITLAPYQEMLINAMFRKNFIMFVACRGASKTFVAAIYCILLLIFEPGTKIVIASANFRTSRRLFTEIEKMIKRDGAELARQCFVDIDGKLKPSKRNDCFEWNLPNGSSCCAIPLSEDTRGARSSLLLLDEMLLLPDKLIDEVLMPFLSARQDADFRLKVRNLEDELIKAGKMTPAARMVFENQGQMIGLSSASYQFEPFYKRFQSWCEFIEHPELLESSEEEEPPSYFVAQLGWEAIPPTILDRSFIESQKASISADSFAREYACIFKDGGDGYYSPKKMSLVTIPDGENPCSLIVGNRDKRYILGIDANASKTKSADFFAMSLIEIDEEKKDGVLVHGFQGLAQNNQDYIKYLTYLFKSFDIALVMVDSMNIDTFIDTVNSDLTWQREVGKTLTYLTEWDSDKLGTDYARMVEESRKQYNSAAGCMVIRQNPTSNWIQQANSRLQANIDHKKIWFASRAATRPDYIEKVFHSAVPMDLIRVRGLGDNLGDEIEDKQLSMRDFIDLQDHIIKDHQDQMAAIQVTTNARGTQSFDLPAAARKSTNVNKPRKDNYSSLLLANWGIKCYFDLIEAPQASKYESICLWT